MAFRLIISALLRRCRCTKPSQRQGWLASTLDCWRLQHDDYCLPVPRQQRRHHILVRRSCMMLLLTLPGIQGMPVLTM